MGKSAILSLLQYIYTKERGIKSVGKYVISFKSIVEFFSKIKNYERYSAQKQEKIRKTAERIINQCNQNMGTYITKADFMYCKIKELTKQRFDIWRTLSRKALERFKGTEYEEIISAKFMKGESYITTSRETHRSISNYYHKMEKIYHYIFMIAYHEELIEVE